MSSSSGRDPVVVVFSGLPGVGKSSIARELARRSGLFHLRVDAIEGPFMDKSMPVTSEGYQALRNLALENLELGIGCIVDCVNPWALTRAMFCFPVPLCRQVNVEVVCSDVEVHRQRLLARGTGPSFTDLASRGYEDWVEADVRIDSAVVGIGEAVELVLSRVGSGDKFAL